MGQADYLALGDWNALCYVCGFKFKASQLQRHWQGYYVCKRDWEPRQPQDFVRAIPDVQTPPWVQPRPDIVLISGSIREYTIDDTVAANVVFFTADFAVSSAEATAKSVFLTVQSGGTFWGPYPITVAVTDGAVTTLTITVISGSGTQNPQLGWA